MKDRHQMKERERERERERMRKLSLEETMKTSELTACARFNQCAMRVEEYEL